MRWTVRLALLGSCPEVQQARTYETAAANVDPTLGVARSLLS